MSKNKKITLEERKVELMREGLLPRDMLRKLKEEFPKRFSNHTNN